MARLVNVDSCAALYHPLTQAVLTVMTLRYMNPELKNSLEEIGELLPADEREDLAPNKAADIIVGDARRDAATRQRLVLRYLMLPFIFLTVALLGGLRLSGIDSSFVFLKPPLLCLIFSAILLALFFRAGLVRLNGWFSEDFPLLKNIVNGSVLVTLFAATTQLFNS